jgi:hypothetical protein
MCGALRLSSELILAGTQDGFSFHVVGNGLHFRCLAYELYCFEGWEDFLGIKRILQVPIQGCDLSLKVMMDGQWSVHFVLSTRSVLVGQASLARKEFPIFAFGAPG